jgi:DNA polymerase III alpha subunit
MTNIDKFISSFGKIEIPIHGVRLPEFIVKGETDGSKDQNFEFLTELCRKGYKKLSIEKGKEKEYADRVKYELETLSELGFVDYILLTWNFINHCKEKNIPTGDGRGSAAGSLVLYLIGVTGLDPIEYGLIFERFISKTRAKMKTVDGITYLDGSLMCDIDCDVDYYRRGELIEFLEKEYGAIKILNLNKMAGKQLIKDCGKIVAARKESEMNEISSLIPTEYGKNMDLEEVYNTIEPFKEWVESNVENRQAYMIALKLRGLIRNKGVHASGMAIAYGDIESQCPIELTKDKDGKKHKVSSYDMSQVSLMFVKLDVLGLKTLSVVDEACSMIGIKATDIDVHDPSIYDFMQDFKYPHGIFQLESWATANACKKIKPKNIDETSAVLAIARPGAIDYIDKYSRYTNYSEYESLHPFFDDVLKETGGVSLFQEQALRMSNKIGFSLEESEILRRCITGDTRFFSKSRGWIKIETLLKDGYKDDLFLVCGENGEKKWKHINDIWSNGKKQIRYVECKNGLTVKATMHHQFLTDSGWKARLRLSEEDYIHYSSNCLDTFGNKTISDDLTIILAGMMTEGYFVYGNNPTFTNYDKNIYNAFYKASSREFGIENITKRPCGKVIALKVNAVEILGKYMKRGLSASKDIPEILFRQDKETIKKFISFSFACEGTITTKELSLTSKSRKLIQKFQLLLLQFGIKTFINTKVNVKYGEYYTLYISREGNGASLKQFSDNFECYLQGYKKEKLDFNKESFKDNTNSRTIDMIPAPIFGKFMNQYPYIPSKLNLSSGRAYSEKGSLRKETFERFCKESGDYFWNSFIQNDVSLSKIKSLKKDIREVEVFDFTIDDETPYIVANGMVIHNCIGKKKKKEMEEWEQKVKEKIKENNLDPEIGNVLWKILEDSANYSFNKSHSAAYTMLTAKTIWLKQNHPKEFYMALLKMAKRESDTLEQISIIEKELGHFGIKLLPPNLIKSGMDFSSEGDDIRYGLTDIKGIKEKSIEKLSYFKDEYSNKFQVFQAATEAKLGLAVMCPLIQAGALTGYSQSRSRMVLEFQLWNNLKAREKLFCIDMADEFDNDLIELIKNIKGKEDENGKPYMKESRLETLRKAYKPYQSIYSQNSKNEDIANWYYENKLLGYNPENRLINIYGDKIPSLKPLEEIQKDKPDTHHTFIGIVVKKADKKSKNGNKYINYIIEDEKAQAEVKLFDGRGQIDQCMKDNGDRLPDENDIVVVDALRKDEKVFFGSQIIVQNVKVYMRLGELKENSDKIE